MLLCCCKQSAFNSGMCGVILDILLYFWCSSLVNGMTSSFRQSQSSCLTVSTVCAKLTGWLLLCTLCSRQESQSSHLKFDKKVNYSFKLSLIFAFLSVLHCLHCLFILCNPFSSCLSLSLAIREKFLTEIQSPRYARLRDWHHDRSARALNIKSWATSQMLWGCRARPEPANNSRNDDYVTKTTTIVNGTMAVKNSPFRLRMGWKRCLG